VGTTINNKKTKRENVGDYKQQACYCVSMNLKQTSLARLQWWADDGERQAWATVISILKRSYTFLYFKYEDLLSTLLLPHTIKNNSIYNSTPPVIPNIKCEYSAVQDSKSWVWHPKQYVNK
jgi:hypothetical protein